MTKTIERSTQVFASGFTGASSPLIGRGGAAQKICILIAVGTTISFRVEGSADGINWATVSMYKDGAANAGFPPSIITDTETVAGLYTFAIAFPWFAYLRINVTANTGVTINGLWLLESDIAKPLEHIQDMTQADAYA